MTHELAMAYQISAEYWAFEYSKNDSYKWQAEWAWKRARQAWAVLDASK